MVTTLLDTATASTPRLLPFTVTAKADLFGVLPLSSASLKVMVSVAPSTVADEGVGGAVSRGVAVASLEEPLSVPSVDAMTRKTYSSPSESPVMMCLVSFT